MSEYLPPVVATFKAEVADAIAKIEELKLAIDSIGTTSRRSIGRVRDDSDQAARALTGTRRAADDAEGSVRRLGDSSRRASGDAASGWDNWLRRMETLFPGVTDRWGRSLTDFQTRNHDAAARMEGDFRTAFRNIVDGEARSAFRAIITGAGDAGDGAGRNFMQRFLSGADGSGGVRKMLAGMGLPALGVAAAVGGGPGLVSGALAPAVGTLAAIGPGALGTLAMLPFIKDAAGEVTKAFTTLETQTNKYNSAADTTAQFLNSDTTAMQNYHTLLGQVTPQQADALQLLTQQDVSWQNLTLSQQQGVIQVRETQDLYKALTQSQKNSVNALLAEKAAWDNLEPSQALALQNYQNMHDTYDKLRTDAMPSMFGMIASAEQAAADLMKPLLPLIQQAALGWKDLFDKIDKGAQSAGYQRFINDMSGSARESIAKFGISIGNVALGIERIFSALRGMNSSSSFMDRMVALTDRFANWTKTPRAIQDLESFSQNMRANGPIVWQTLGNLTKALGDLLLLGGENQYILQLLNFASKLVLWLVQQPWGRAAIEITATAVAVGALAEKLKLLALAEGIAGLFGGGSAASGAAGAAGAAGRAGAAAGAGGAAAGGLGGAIAGRLAPITGGLRFGAVTLVDSLGVAGLAGPIGLITAGGVALAGAVMLYGDHVKRQSDQAAGVITQANGVVVAATVNHGVKTSAAFRDLADSYQTGGKVTAATVLTTTQDYRTGIGKYNTTIAAGNQKVKDVLNLGKDELGQSFALFDAKLGGDVAATGAALGKTGKTLGDLMNAQAQTIFIELGAKIPGFWQALGATSNKAAQAAFDAMQKRSAQDYGDLQSKYNQLENDLHHGRVDEAKRDFASLGLSMQGFMDDAVKGNIDNSNKRLSALGKDIQNYFTDMVADPSGAKAAADLVQLGKDLGLDFSTFVASLKKDAAKAMDAEIASAQSDISRIQNSIPLPFGHAAGGPISGPGTGTSDSILARVSNGEFIVNAQASARHGQLLHAINSNRFASGGLVGPDMSGGRILADQERIVGQMTLIQRIQQAQQQAAATALGHATGPGGQQAIAYAASRLGLHGWGQDQLPPLIQLWNQESGWNSNAVNPSSGAYGIPQSLGHGHPYDLGDYRAQVDWGLNYIGSSYGSPARAWSHEQGYNWYDSGGVARPGLTGLMNGTGKPEAVLTASQWSSIASLAAAGAQAAAGGVTVPIVVMIDGKTVYESTRTVGYQRQFRNGKSVWSFDR